MRRTRWTPVLTLVLAVAAGACGSNGEQVLAGAAQATADAGTSRMAMTVSASAPDGSGATAGAEDFTMNAEGVIDYDTGHGILKMDLGALGMPGAEGEAEMRLMGSVVYMKVPGTELGGRPWVKFDLEALGEDGQGPVPALNPASNDPRGVLDALRGVSGEVEEVGAEDIRGVATTHYRAEVDLDKAQAEVPEERRADFEIFSEQLGIDTLPIDVWVDDEGRARRFSYELETPAAGETPASAVNLVIDLYDFGVEVDVQPPPSAEVTDYGELDPAA
ncbi:MAG: hypothetical protein KY395_05775 [Actinobacteria bacterium]|nr:hypothetical protein [Actinomycetota bacterium]